LAEKQRLAAGQLKLRQENEAKEKKLNLEKKALIEKEKAQAATVTHIANVCIIQYVIDTFRISYLMIRRMHLSSTKSWYKTYWFFLLLNT
jgi:hypothetical protein